MHKHLTDRIVGVVILLTSIWYGYSASKFEITPLMDPVGPRAFPYMLAAIMVVFSLIMIVRPKGKRVEWPKLEVWLRIGIIAIVLILYAFLLVPLGFILSTALVMTSISFTFKGPLLKSFIIALIFSIALFGLFDTLLGLNIPSGKIFLFLRG